MITSSKILSRNLFANIIADDEISRQLLRFLHNPHKLWNNLERKSSPYLAGACLVWAGRSHLVMLEV